MATKYKTRAAQKRYRARKKQYRNYLSQFDDRLDAFERRGLDFYDPNPLSYRDWKTVYAEKKNSLREDVIEGKRKSIGNVNREIVSDQAYELSAKQADVISEYLMENESDLLAEMDLTYRYTDEAGVERMNLKKKIDLMMKIRQGEFVEEDIGLWDLINDFRAHLFEKGLSKEEVRQQVGQTFFNSPK